MPIIHASGVVKPFQSMLAVSLLSQRHQVSGPLFQGIALRCNMPSRSICCMTIPSLTSKSLQPSPHPWVEDAQGSSALKAQLQNVELRQELMEAQFLHDKVQAQQSITSAAEIGKIVKIREIGT